MEDAWICAWDTHYTVVDKNSCLQVVYKLSAWLLPGSCFATRIAHVAYTLQVIARNCAERNRSNRSYRFCCSIITDLFSRRNFSHLSAHVTAVGFTTSSECCIRVLSRRGFTCALLQSLTMKIIHSCAAPVQPVLAITQTIRNHYESTCKVWVCH